MERRLKLAKRLLNPENSVLIVTIDEKEYLRLGLLLEQLFVAENIQMVSIVINPLGQERAQQLARVEEYAFFVFIGKAAPIALQDDLLNRSDKDFQVRSERLLPEKPLGKRAQISSFQCLSISRSTKYIRLAVQFPLASSVQPLSHQRARLPYGHFVPMARKDDGGVPLLIIENCLRQVMPEWESMIKRMIDGHFFILAKHR
jgi:hypothetical protein